jgi:hypothetical protein
MEALAEAETLVGSRAIGVDVALTRVTAWLLTERAALVTRELSGAIGWAGARVEIRAEEHVVALREADGRASVGRDLREVGLLRSCAS